MRTKLKSGITISLTLLLTVCSIKASCQPKLTSFVGHEDITAAEKQVNADEDPLYQFSKTYPVVFTNLIAEFKAIKNLKYSATGKNLYLSFKSNDCNISSVYSKKGKMRYAISNLGITLPRKACETLQKDYPGYMIFNVRKIKTRSDTVYQVIVENQSEYRILNIFSNESEEVSSIRK